MQTTNLTMKIVKLSTVHWTTLLFLVSLTLSLLFCFVVSPKLIGSGMTRLDPDAYGKVGQAWYETGTFDSIAPPCTCQIALLSCAAGSYHVWTVQVAQCVRTALPGAVRAVRRRSWALAHCVPVIGIMGVSLSVFAFARLSATIMPYLIGLAAYGLERLFTSRPRTT